MGTKTRLTFWGLTSRELSVSSSESESAAESSFMLGAVAVPLFDVYHKG